MLNLGLQICENLGSSLLTFLGDMYRQSISEHTTSCSFAKIGSGTSKKLSTEKKIK